MQEDKDTYNRFEIFTSPTGTAHRNVFLSEDISCHLLVNDPNPPQDWFEGLTGLTDQASMMERLKANALTVSEDLKADRFCEAVAISMKGILCRMDVVGQGMVCAYNPESNQVSASAPQGLYPFMKTDKDDPSFALADLQRRAHVKVNEQGFVSVLANMDGSSRAYKPVYTGHAFGASSALSSGILSAHAKGNFMVEPLTVAVVGFTTLWSVISPAKAMSLAEVMYKQSATSTAMVTNLSNAIEVLGSSRGVPLQSGKHFLIIARLTAARGEVPAGAHGNVHSPAPVQSKILFPRQMSLPAGPSEKKPVEADGKESVGIPEYYSDDPEIPNNDLLAMAENDEGGIVPSYIIKNEKAYEAANSIKEEGENDYDFDFDLAQTESGMDDVAGDTMDPNLKMPDNVYNDKTVNTGDDLATMPLTNGRDFDADDYGESGASTSGNTFDEAFDKVYNNEDAGPGALATKPSVDDMNSATSDYQDGYVEPEFDDFGMGDFDTNEFGTGDIDMGMSVGMENDAASSCNNKATCPNKGKTPQLPPADDPYAFMDDLEY